MDRFTRYIQVEKAGLNPHVTNNTARHARDDGHFNPFDEARVLL
jgi:hypothetical protein